MVSKKDIVSIAIKAYKVATEATIMGAIDCLSSGLYIFLRRKS